MSSSYTQTFGGNTIYPSDVSYLALNLTADVALQWPLEANVGPNIVARIMDVTADAAHAIIMPDATQTGVGQTVLFNNLSGYTITVKDSTGGTILAMPTATVWELYLTDNTTAAGSWHNVQFGSSVSQAQASLLAGYGLKAISTTLNQGYQTTLFNSSYTLGSQNRASLFVWSGGSAGTLTLPAAAGVGNGWFVMVNNSGSGQLAVAPAGSETIDGFPVFNLQIEDSATFITDGLNWYTVGFGQNPVFAFDYTSINLAGSGTTYTLSGSELNRIAYKFVGALSNNVKVVVPSTIQQYWVDNETTGAYTVSIATSTQASPILIPQASRAITYCDGTNVVLASASTASLPTVVPVAQGGTGATTAGGALVNLGGTATGVAVFNSASTSAAQVALGATATGQALFGAASAAAARTAITAAASGANSDITSLSGLTTALSVPQGGTGAVTLTGYVKGGGTSAMTASSTIPTSDISGAAALTKTDDTNVTLTLGGSPSTALLAATSLALGWTGQLSVSRGGTGAATLTGYVKGSGTSAFTASSTIPTSDLTGTLGVANGGTGATTLTGYVKGSGTSAFTASSTVPTSDLSGTVAVANGGTALSSTPTNGQLLIGNGTNYTLATITAGSGVTVTNGAGTITIAASSSGLTNWTEGVNTSSPNATVPVVFFNATNAATNVDAVVAPKGTGAFALRTADGTSTGGNKRGTNAVDLQTARGAAAQVASGANSFVAGNSSTASGAQSVAIGNTNTASGGNSVALGAANTASGNQSSALGGTSNTASGQNSAVVGGSYGTTRGAYGMVHGGSPIANTAGASQHRRTVLGRQTTDTTATVLAADTSAAGATNQVNLPNNSAFYFKGTVIANVTGGGNTKGWTIEGVIKQGANAASTALVGSATVTSNYADAGASTWSVAVSADTTNGCLAITVTGQASTTIRWVASIETTEVTF